MDIEGRPLTVDTPLRIASNTKTFTAAAILRLAEMEKLSIDDAISEYIDPQYNTLLSTQYNTHAITIRHLLEHSSGLLDHADGDYLKAVLKQPNYVWSRTEQIEMYMRKQFPRFRLQNPLSIQIRVIFCSVILLNGLRGNLLA